jgi:MurNAc alpha-1-phosphate uridylyltransferase
VAYSHEGPQLLGTGGAVRRALPLLGDRFMVLYGDTYLRIDYADVARSASDSGLTALMTVLRNEGRWDTSNAAYRDGKVLRYDKRNPDPDMAYIDYGLSVLTPAALAQAPDDSDLAGMFTALAAKGELAGYEALHRFYEIGTAAALAEAEEFLARRDTRPDG